MASLAPRTKSAPVRGTTAERDYGTLHQTLRKALLALYPVCQICKAAWATIAHHLVRPATELRHYQAVCYQCHKRLHQN